MPQTDSRGLPLSTDSETAAARYRAGVDLLLSAWPGADAALDDAIAADPDFALAHAARARLDALRLDGAAARSRIATATALAERHGTARERSHVAVLATLIGGDAPGALRGVLAHLDSWPRDVLIFGLALGAFGLFAFSGMADHDQARVDLCERHAAAFAEGDWWFLNYRGWSHAENGAPALGRRLAERSHRLRRANANGVHALAHAMHEQGATDEAERLIDGWLPEYDRQGTLHGHVAWHAALGALGRGDTARALELYAAHVQPAVSAALPLNVLTDSVSFLWRLHVHGQPVPAEAWRAAAEYAAPRYAKVSLPFADVHMAIVEAATGDRAALARREAALEALVEAGSLAAGPVVPALCRAVLAFAEGEYARCARLLEPVASEVVRIGGSGAQREMIEDTLLVALMRGGEAARARTLLDRRLHRRPSARDAAWRSDLVA